MVGKRDKSKEIVAKLLQGEVLQGQGQGMGMADVVRSIDITQLLSSMNRS